MSEGGWLNSLLNIGGLAHGASELAEARHMAHLGHGMSTATNMAIAEGTLLNSGGATVANALAPLALANGINHMYHNTIGHRGEMGLDNYAGAAAGAAEAFSGGVGTMGLVGAGLNAVGATGAGGALTGAAAAAGPAAMVAGAGAAGYAVGTGLANIADSNYTRTGFWGRDEDTGQNRSAMDWGANWGTSVDEWLGNRPGETSVLGGIAAGAGGIVGGIGGAVHGAANFIGSGISSLADTVSSW